MIRTDTPELTRRLPTARLTTPTGHAVHMWRKKNTNGGAILYAETHRVASVSGRVEHLQAMLPTTSISPWSSRKSTKNAQSSHDALRPEF